MSSPVQLNSPVGHFQPVADAQQNRYPSLRDRIGEKAATVQNVALALITVVGLALWASLKISTLTAAALIFTGLAAYDVYKIAPQISLTKDEAAFKTFPSIESIEESCECEGGTLVLEPTLKAIHKVVEFFRTIPR